MSMKAHFTLFLHSPVLLPAKINSSENAHEDKNTKINSRENKFIYSTQSKTLFLSFVGNKRYTFQKATAGLFLIMSVDV